ncbi:A-kinase anchor protein 1, mitochondrial isoform X2 [Dasypus novemcinctus]|uniref:A-kinase anchor protein 1, mitochondrial isoform X2 n=1 Tax=Dasypus novemcinctus TaxID=9361 RepID=UPI00265F7B64|nr:A-kinase anchor protein 1, mitochondrial isoform X2 [Dasypus novemcinctus]
MAIQFRSLFPLALPGMLALLGWWWFFSRKKEHVSSHSKQVEASAVGLSTDPAIEDPLPTEDAGPGAGSASLSVTQLPEKEPFTVSKPCAEPPALLRAHPAPRRSESSGSLPNTTDTRFRPGTRKDDSAKLEIALTCDEVKSIPLECPLPSTKGVPFPHEAVEACSKRESTLGRAPGRGWPALSAAPTEKRGPGEKARETGGAEGTGDAVLGESLPEEGVMSWEHGSELERSKVPSLAPLGGGEENEKTSLAQVVGPAQKEGYGIRKLSSFLEPAHTELVRDDEMLEAQARDLVGERGADESLERNEKIEQAAIQIISKVLLEATEEVRATVAEKSSGHKPQASADRQPGHKEEGCALDRQTPVTEQGTTAPALATAEAATAEAAMGALGAVPPSSDPAEGLSLPKTYVSCLDSPMSSPTKDTTPKHSAHPISLVTCPLVTPLGMPLDGAGVLAEGAGGPPCMSDSSQGVPSVVSSGPCSDSASTSGLEDSCPETNSSPRDKASTPPLPESTVPFSNGVLKGELSDLGAEDGWTMDAEADHSGGSDGNSMDSMDSCCGLRKTEGFQSVQAGSDAKKVDLIIWEIEVPKHLVGRLIGKQGRYVSFLKQTSGAKIYISTLPYTQNIQICHIEGSQHHVDKALKLIGKKFKELNLTNIYAPPLPSLALPSLPMTSWLMLPNGITVEVIVVNQVNAGHLFVQQHTHPTFHALRSLDQQMYLCYSQPGIPTLPTPVENEETASEVKFFAQVRPEQELGSEPRSVAVTSVAVVSGDLDHLSSPCS